MATLPTPATVLYTPGLWVPLVVAGGNVHILPGIPRLFSQMIEANAENFRGPACHSQTVYTKLGEGDVADPLAAVAAAHPAVRIGSYPNTSFTKNAAYNVKLQFESRDAEAVAAAVAAIKTQLPIFTLDS